MAGNEILTPGDTDPSRLQMRRIVALLRSSDGAVLRGQRRQVIERRIRERIAGSGTADAGDYLKRLHADPDELSMLRADLTCVATPLFREAPRLETLRQEFISPLLQERDARQPLRAWVVGCGNGEDAYSLAIVLAEALSQNRGTPQQLRLFATATDQGAVHTSSRGCYRDAALSAVAPSARQRFFERVDSENYRASEVLRQCMLFSVHRPGVDPPFSRMDLIYCAESLDALAPSLRREVLQSFHFALNRDGALLLSETSTLDECVALFDPIPGGAGLYRVREPSLSWRGSPPTAGARAQRSGDAADAAPSPRGSLRTLAQQLLSDAFAPASVLIDARREVLYHHGATEKYLTIPAGAPTKLLTALARSGLADALNLVYLRAERTGEPAMLDDVQVQRDGVAVPIEVEARPAFPGRNEAGLMLISFRDRPCKESGQAPTSAGKSPSEAPDGSAEQRVAALEKELAAMRRDAADAARALQSAEARLQEVSEDLMAANEELQVSNEQLQTMRDSLQSTNLELGAVNTSLREKVDALQLANNDIANLLANVQTATIFLDSQLRIKLFTAGCAALIRLRGSDIGRPLCELSFVVPDTCLIDDCEALIAGKPAREREVSGDDGDRYLRRVELTSSGGVVVSYIDISARAASEDRLRSSEEHYRAVFERSPICLLEQDWSDVRASLEEWGERLRDRPSLLDDEPETMAIWRKRVRLTAVNRAARELLEIDGEVPPENPLLPSARPEAFAEVLRQLAQGRTAVTVEDELCVSGDKPVAVLCHYVMLPGSEDDMRRVLVTMIDNRERRALEDAILASEQRLRRALHVVHEGVWDYDARNNHLWWSEEYARLWGEPPPGARTSYQWLFDRIHPDDRDEVCARIRAVIDGDGDLWRAEYRFRRSDGSYAHVLDSGAITRDESGRVVRVLGCMLDTSDLKETQRQLQKREQRLRSVLDAAADAIITVNSNGRILSFNPAAERIFGHISRDVLGQSVCMLFSTVDGRLLHRDLASERREGAWPEQYDRRVLEGRRADETTFPAEVSVRPTENRTTFVLFARDLTERRRLEREIIAMGTRQQQEIGREIHDGLGQELTALLMLASGMERKLARQDGSLGVEEFGKLTAYMKRALDTARNLSKGLAPTDILAEGLPAALQDLTGRMESATGIPCRCTTKGDIGLDDSNRATHLYRIAQEALSNSARHAEANRMEVQLEAVADGVVLTICDDGIGISPTAGESGRLGLHLMRYRANLLGGQCTVEARPGGGTVVRCEVPIEGVRLPI
jgi:two-component system CheB/CheR fusion protein